jgi:hypothetical protein
LRFIVFGVRVFMQIVYIGLAKRLIDTFGYGESSTCFWQESTATVSYQITVKYKIAGADARIGSLYEEFRVFLSLLKIDFVMFGFLLLLAKAFMLKTGSPEFIVGVTSAAFAVLWSCVGWLGIVAEASSLVFAFICCSLLQPTWVAFKLWRVEEHPGILPPQIALWQFALISSMFVFTRCVTIYMTVRCYKNFGQGLREGVFLAVATREARQDFLGSTSPTHAKRDIEAAPPQSLQKPLLREFEGASQEPASVPSPGNVTTMSRLAAMYAAGNFDTASGSGSIQEDESSSSRQQAGQPGGTAPNSERLAQFMHDYR